MSTSPSIHHARNSSKLNKSGVKPDYTNYSDTRTTWFQLKHSWAMSPVRLYSNPITHMGDWSVELGAKSPYLFASTFGDCVMTEFFAKSAGPLRKHSFFARLFTNFGPAETEGSGISETR